LLAVAIGLAACNPVASPTPAVDRVNVSAVAAIDATRLVAVGGTDDARGSLVVALSADGGRSWTTMLPVGTPALTRVTWTGERLVGARECVTPRSPEGPLEAAAATCLFASTDGGVTWSDLHAGRLVEPTFADAQHGWSRTPSDPAGAPTALRVTADGGATWTAAASPCPETVPLIGALDNTAPGLGFALCFGPAGDNGQPWSLVEVTQGGSVIRHSGRQSGKTPEHGLDDDAIQGFAMLADGSGLLWATEALYQTRDRGVTWEPVAVDASDRGSFWGGGAILDGGTAFLTRRNTGAYTSIWGSVAGGQWQQLVRWPFFGGPPTP
jgi:hypothetical protein